MRAVPCPELARGGEPEIRIIERNAQGGLVSSTRRWIQERAVGRPGQLSDHLDMHVIKRLLDQLLRPLTRPICVKDLETGRLSLVRYGRS